MVNKVASNAKKEEQKAAAEAVAAKGHSLEIGDDQKGTVHLPGRVTLGMFDVVFSCTTTLKIGDNPCLQQTRCIRRGLMS